MKPTLPIQQFQIVDNLLYVLDENGIVWRTDGLSNGENWINYCEKLSYRPIPDIPPTRAAPAVRYGKDGKIIP